jgi:hypothetical protein
VVGSAKKRSGIEDGEDLSFGDHIVKADEYRFELAGGRCRHRDFHLHGFDKCDVVAVANGSSDFDGECANAPRHLGHDLDLWHSNPQGTV